MPTNNNAAVLNEDLRKQLDELLGNTDLTNVTAEGSGFSNLPTGYYLTEVKKATLTVSKSSGLPMVSLQLQVVSDGWSLPADEKASLTPIPKTKGRITFVHYPFKDASSVTRFASDMIKFEGDKPGEPLLPKDAFKRSDTLEDALSILEEVGPRVWVDITESATPNPSTGAKGTFTNLISWKRAIALGLPVDED